MDTALAVGEIFFPQREALGLESRELTPASIQKIVYAGSESPSFSRAVSMLNYVGGVEVSTKTIERVTMEVGAELVARRDAEAGSPVQPSLPVEVPPALAIVQADGGRILTRAEGCGPGVHGEQWRETKNACLLRMTHQTFDVDPHPELPRAFCDPEKMAKLVGKELFSGIALAEPSSVARTIRATGCLGCPRRAR